MFTVTESDIDHDRLLSPYFEEEAVDNDSLYLSLCARRRANSQLKSMESSTMGALFFPPTIAEDSHSIFDDVQRVL